MKRAMEDWEWEAWAEKTERLEHTLWRLLVVISVGVILLANVFALVMIGSSLREFSDGVVHAFAQKNEQPAAR